MRVEADGDFDGGFGDAFGELPLGNGGLRGVRENGVAAQDFNVFYGAVSLDGDFEADGATDAAAFENGGILGFDFFNDAAGRFLRVDERRSGENEERAKESDTRNGASSAHGTTFKN